MMATERQPLTPVEQHSERENHKQTMKGKKKKGRYQTPCQALYR